MTESKKGVTFFPSSLLFLARSFSLPFWFGGVSNTVEKYKNRRLSQYRCFFTKLVSCRSRVSSSHSSSSSSSSSLSMVAIDRIAPAYPSLHLQEMLKLAQKPAPLATPTTSFDQGESNDAFASVINGSANQRISPSQFGLDPNKPSLQFSTPGGGFVQVFGPLNTPGNDKFFHDPNPVVIQKKSKPITYVQKINLAYYKPPAPPAPGPVIIKEVN